MSYSLSRLERVYTQLQSAFDTIPNSTGTATLANSDYLRTIKFNPNNEVATLVRRDKTGSRTATQGTAGRGFGKWSLELSLSPNGTVGVVPDADDVLQCLFGQAPTVTPAGTISVTSCTAATPSVATTAAHGFTTGTYVAGTIAGSTQSTINQAWIAKVLSSTTLELQGSTLASGATGGTFQKGCVKYAMSDSIQNFVGWSFRQPSTLAQRAAFGCSVTNATFNLGADIAEWSCEGENMWTIDTDQFATAADQYKGGLTTFPTEPSAPTYNGGIIAGFTGGAYIGGAKIASIRSTTLRIGTGNVVVKDLFGSTLPDSTEGDERQVVTSFSMYDDDSVSQKAIRLAGISKTPLDIIYQMGIVSGNTVLFLLKSVQLPSSSLDDGQRRYVSSVSDARAFGTSLTALDEVTMFIV
jgi:hypothetical protein